MTQDPLTQAVLEDIRCHRENGVDVNPFSTHRARSSWQNGFQGANQSLLDWPAEYQRGQLAAQLLQEQP